MTQVRVLILSSEHPFSVSHLPRLLCTHTYFLILTMDNSGKSREPQVGLVNMTTKNSADASSDTGDLQTRRAGTSRRVIQVSYYVFIHKMSPPLTCQICITAALGGFLYGFSANAMSGTLAQPSFIALFLTTTDATSRMDGLLGGYVPHIVPIMGKD